MRRRFPVSPDQQMTDFVAARRMMVDGQVRTSDVTDLRLIAAMREVPRERFLPPAQRSFAYFDLDLPLAAPEANKPLRHLIKPMVLGKLIQAAEIRDDDHVLDVGCGTGYSTALLARLAGSVVALEEDAALAQQAAETLRALGVTQAQVATGPLAGGWPALAPYDAILVNGAFEVAPKALLRQLRDGGRLVGVMRGAAGKAMLYRSAGGECSGRPIFDAFAPLLPGFAVPPAFVF
jgi:protein-L-isoaspartate(D-aspartate) O-methyltransferase